MQAKRADGQAVMFLGPTLATLPARTRSLCRASGFQVRRPVRRGDIESLLASRRKRGLIVIVDGVFHDTLAVGHAEIRDALERGWRVWGLSSMGAIRAREMAHLGMRGYGSVYQRKRPANRTLPRRELIAQTPSRDSLSPKRRYFPQRRSPSPASSVWG